MSAPPPKPLKPTVEDTDEDLDDLDDVLSQFSSPNPPPPTATSTAGFSRPRTNTRVVPPPAKYEGSGSKISEKDLPEADELQEDFARELAKGMENLMREMGAGGEPSEADGDNELTQEEKETEKLFKAAWEAMLVDGMNGQGENLADLGDPLGDEGVKAKSTSPGPSGSGSGDRTNFQETIKQAMEKLKQTESGLKADSASSGEPSEGSNETFESILSSLVSEDNEDDLAGMLDNMMSQLMSKDVLYEPLKELSDKFPVYLTENASTLSAEDKSRFEKQRTAVRQIVAVFEAPGYNDSDGEANSKVVELMAEMQSYGSPPSEIMGPLPPGFAVGPDGLPQVGEGCVVA